MFQGIWLTRQEVTTLQQTKKLSVAGTELKQIYPTEEINVIWNKRSQ